MREPSKKVWIFVVSLNRNETQKRESDKFRYGIFKSRNKTACVPNQWIFQFKCKFSHLSIGGGCIRMCERESSVYYHIFKSDHFNYLWFSFHRVIREVKVVRHFSSTVVDLASFVFRLFCRIDMGQHECWSIYLCVRLSIQINLK